MSIIRQTLNSKKSLVIILLLLIFAITFETFQQLYYLKRFNLAEDVSFFHILKLQSYRWIVWMILGLLLVIYAKREASKIP
ncbi:MAG: hypothetical protein KUG68_01905, partial [Flavobacteriaceae bacterium]|nr:hypothetical protein [Flavobacteriaceae bacterium]